MKKIILAAAVVLVAGTPLAFAATSGNDTTEPSSRTCTYQGEKWDICHQDTHKNGGAESKSGGLSKH